MRALFVFEAAVRLNDPHLKNVLFADDYFAWTLGCLECTCAPSHPRVQMWARERASCSCMMSCCQFALRGACACAGAYFSRGWRKYRNFVAQNIQYREIIPFADPDTTKRIHQNFRLQFVKGV
ncbi:hypothetical protein EON66_08610 [archaeon]|nr:MAG: hypothetical protein EON66_08610 [archaeon]